MAVAEVPDEISFVSKGLYVIMNHTLGTEQTVELRRQKYDIPVAFSNCENYRNCIRMSSGSRSEGFELESSDVDEMHLDRKATVLTRSSLRILSNISMTTLLLMETDNVTPGFALIRCLKYHPNHILLGSLIRRGNDMYVGSKHIRETFMSSSGSTTHGPCQTHYSYTIESDNAYTLNCPFWPEGAISFITRAIERGWPTYDVLINACKDGCLFVPINSKQQYYKDIIDLEWRISFSLAEKKLIRSMNHCQFLVYGLSKLFLNEVLKRVTPNKDLLCSYYLKTALFWEISENSQDWSSAKLLSKFWNVFRRLIKWVSLGYSPNFFIPENNMFYGKICGQNQRHLIAVLRDIYSEGYLSLLRCSSLNQALSTFIPKPVITQRISVKGLRRNCECTILWEQICTIAGFDEPFVIFDTEGFMAMMAKTLKLNVQSEEMMLAKRLRVNKILQTFAVLLLTEKSLSCPGNKMQYGQMQKAKNILLRMKTYFCMNYFEYAKCLYTVGKYQETIEIIHFIKQRLQSQPYMYLSYPDHDILYTSRNQGIPSDKLINSFVLSYVDINSLTSIDELLVECKTKHQSGLSCIEFIPFLVFLNFLLFLSYRKLGENRRARAILDEQQTLIHYDNGYHIDEIHKAISWEILGISQQLCGDHETAFQSFSNALDDKYNHFESGTLGRIIHLLICILYRDQSNCRKVENRKSQIWLIL